MANEEILVGRSRCPARDPRVDPSWQTRVGAAFDFGKCHMTNFNLVLTSKSKRGNCSKIPRAAAQSHVFTKINGSF